MLTNRIDIRSYSVESHSHSHEFAQLVLPVSGSMDLEVGSDTGMLNPDLGVYIAPEDKHCFAGGRNNQFLVIDVLNQNYPSNSHFISLTSSTKKLVHFTQHYLAQNERDVFIDASINELLLHFAASPCAPKMDQTVLNAKQWIHVNVANPVNVQCVAKHCFLSLSQLQRRFKKVVGCSVAEYWRMKKLQLAKRLLSQTNDSVECIAFKVGYENLPAFSRRFSKVFGEPPSEWRLKTASANNMRQTDHEF